MEILVNQEPLSYALESEDSLGQVIDGLARWLKDGQFAITAIDVDDRILPIHDRSHWQDLAIGSVSRLSVEAFPLSHVEQTTLAAIGDYCILLGRAVQNKDAVVLKELAEELPYVRSRLEQYFPSLSTPDSAGGLLRDDALEQGDLPRSDASARLNIQLASIGTLVDSRLREFENPMREIGLTLGRLVACSEPLTQVPIQLQTGEGDLAMSIIIRFTELLSRAIRLLPLAAENTRGMDTELDTDQIGRFALDLTPFLQQLQAAFETQDGVLIGDLLEYEIAPRLAALPSLIPDAYLLTEESSQE